VYKDLSKDEYESLKKYQNETGVQVIYPLQNNYQSVGANQWYRLTKDAQAAAEKLHGEKVRYPAAAKAEGARDEKGRLTPDYKTVFSEHAFGYDSLRLDFSGTDYEEGKPVFAPPISAENSTNAEYLIKRDEQGRLYYWYDDQTGYAYRDENYEWQKAQTGAVLQDALGYYAYAFENQSGYRVRVCYYEYFKFLHGEYPKFLFGTNQYGQDLFACLASGARLSFLLAVCVAAINLTIGAAYGAISGYYGGKIDIVLGRIAEFLSAVPLIVAATLFELHIGKLFGPLITLIFVFSLTGWLSQAARVRMQFYRFKGREYVLAAKTLGAKDGRIMLKHIFPNALGTIVTGAALAIPAVIFSESTLSYLGIINFETSGFISLGAMLSQGQSIIATAPHVLFFPALFIALLEIAFNLFGNGLRDALNPTLR
jgi:ABC-type dipeptide/oligopeptide/nickel transport system permease subunit